MSIIDSDIHESANMYKDVTIKNARINAHASVGDFSKVENSVLNDYVRIDRNNYIFSSEIGRHSYTGSNTKIIKASVGNFVSVSWNVSIGGANHDYTKLSTHSFLYNSVDKIRPQDMPPIYDRFQSECVIGHDVWIGTGAIILRNCHIGNGAVIAAGAVVTKDIPPYAIVAGVPARIIKYRFGKERVAELETIQWWNWSDEKIRDNINMFV